MLTANRLNGTNKNDTAQSASKAELIANFFGWGPLVPINAWAVHVCVATIMPWQAQHILSQMHIKDNRTKKEKNYTKILSAMLRGEWTRTHQGIAFSRDGLLYDGQHRLQACIDTNTPFETLVFFDFDRTVAMLATDIGAPKSNQDIGKTCGLGINNRRSGTLKWLAFGKKKVPGLSPTQESELLNLFNDSLEFCEQHMVGSKPGVQKSPVWGVVCRAYYHESRTRLAEFCGILMTGAMDKDKRNTDIAALNLNQKLLTLNLTGGPGLAQCFMMTANACRSFCSYVSKQKVNYTDIDDLYPLDDELISKMNKILGTANA